MSIELETPPLKYRRTKIVATLGPASREPEVLARLLAAGVDVVRLNFSHGSHDSHRECYERVRRAAAEAGRPVAVLADLCGPKIRVGEFPGGSIELVCGATLTVTTRDVPGAPGLIPSQYESLHEDVAAGSRLLLDDGNLELVVTKVDGTEITASVVRGGVLRDKKGINLPGVEVSSPTLTEKDRIDAAFALALGVDLLALSFVRRAEDVHELRAIIAAAGSQAGIIAKIERREALAEIDFILAASDGIMVARGDLGVELPPQSVPVVQEQLIELARAQAKPVIVATQMIESMIAHSRPTRAEVSDIANAVRSGADAVMLSAETASGRYPVEAVQMMDLVAREAEAYQWQRGAFGKFTRHEGVPRPLSFEEALALSTAQLSRDLLVRSIVVLSRHGRSPAVMSASRPGAPIVAMFTDERLCRASNLLWGTIPVRADDSLFDDPRSLARAEVLKLGLAEPGQVILIVRGFSTDPESNQPSVTISTI